MRGWIGCTQADKKMAFDHFHIAKVLSEALDKVRRKEHKELRAQGNEILKGTRYIWLTSESRMSSKQREHFEGLRDAILKTAEAWAIKDMAAQLWNARGGRDWVNKVWQDWLEWAQGCSLEPIRKAAQTIKEHHALMSHHRPMQATHRPIQSKVTKVKNHRNAYSQKMCAYGSP